MSDRRKFMRTAGAAAAGIALAEALGATVARAEGRSDRVDDFIRSVQRAKLYDLSHVWDENSPIASVNPPYAMQLNKTHATPAEDPAGTRGTFGDGGQLSFTSEVQQWSGQHGAPSIDAIGHIGRDGFLHGHVIARDATSDHRGIGRSGVGANLDIANYPTKLLVNRGVLLDVARFLQPKGHKGEPLAPQVEITDQILADTADEQGVRIRKGDTVLIRTGWGQYFKNNPTLYAGADSPGVGVAGGRYLVRQKPAVVGNDTLTFERRPPLAFPPDVPAFQVFPVHMLVIADNGINIIENYFLEDLAEDREYEFLLVVPPLKILGGTGSALRSFALVPPG
jgi:kynurenine formamidase